MFKKYLISIIFILTVILKVSDCCADEEAGNSVYGRTDDYGIFYVKSIPSESYGLKGKTLVYKIEAGQDKLLHTFDWYSPEIYVTGFTAGDFYLVKFGPWHRGHEAKPDHLAIAFYKADKLIKEYSTVDFVENPQMVAGSISHYQIFGKRLGFRRPFGNQLYYEVEDSKNNVLTFDLETGKIVSKEDQLLQQALSDATNKIQQLKFKWYQVNEKTLKDINNQIITEEDLKTVAENDFPALPQGYEYVPSKMWGQEVLRKKVSAR